MCLMSDLHKKCVMLTLILIDFQYSQKAVFSFEKGSNYQNHSSSGSLQLVIKFQPLVKYLIPPTLNRYLENPGDIVQIYFRLVYFQLLLNMKIQRVVQDELSTIFAHFFSRIFPPKLKFQFISELLLNFHVLDCKFSIFMSDRD